MTMAGRRRTIRMSLEHVHDVPCMAVFRGDQLSNEYARQLWSPPQNDVFVNPFDIELGLPSIPNVHSPHFFQSAAISSSVAYRSLSAAKSARRRSTSST